MSNADERKIIIAENSGFCFGVKRATGKAEELAVEMLGKGKVYTLGKLIHNDVYNEKLKKMGVEVIDETMIEEIASKSTKDNKVCVIFRAHGVTLECENKFKELVEKYENFSYVDCTCPFVKKIHKIVEENSESKNMLFLLGHESHPETMGILSRFKGDKLVFADSEELSNKINLCKNGNLEGKIPIIAAQTTQNSKEWKKTQKIIKNLYTNAKFFDTICSVTELRQKEADELSKACDFMIVVGGRESSNTEKLFKICKSNCENTVWIEKSEELVGMIPTAWKITGVVGGASTPPDTIEEVYKTMSATKETKENFAQMLEDQPLKTLNTGDVVTGTVEYVSDTELQLDLGAGVTGIIKAEQITDDTSVKLTDTYKQGDQIEAFVIRVSDIEGVAELSKKRVDADRKRSEIIEAKETGAVLEGKVIEAVKGGVIVSVEAVRIFVPASQTGVPRDGDLNSIVGTKVKLKVIDIRDNNRAIGSIRQVQREERRAAEEAFWQTIEEGKQYTGKVKSMTSYGAFVDLGGVDGMVHASELSWKHIKSPADVVSIGEEITVYVKSFDAEKKRISLGYKTEDTNPWFIFTNKYAEGDVASVKIVSLTTFGAFAEIVDGVDGLIHISQIANKRIAQPSDVLEVGQVVDAKITAIDNEKKKVSLSIRALIEEADEQVQEAEAENNEAESEAEAE